MLKIAVIGDNGNCIANTLKELFYPSEITADDFSYYSRLNENNIDLLVVHSLKSDDIKAELLKSGITAEAAIINSDEDNIYQTIANKSNRVVTYGFNNKACITASSISDGATVFCIQRSLVPINGGSLDRQEFSIHTEGIGADCILAAVSAALVGGVTIEDINLT